MPRDFIESRREASWAAERAGNVSPTEIPYLLIGGPEVAALTGRGNEVATRLFFLPGAAVLAAAIGLVEGIGVGLGLGEGAGVMLVLKVSPRKMLGWSGLIFVANVNPNANTDSITSPGYARG